MSQRTDAQLTTEKDIIENETTEGANTKTRVGDMLENIIDSKINNDKIETASTLDTSGKTVAGRDAVKSALNAKSDVLPTFRDPAGAHTLDAADLTAVNEGKNYIIDTSVPGVLTIPLNATVDFENGILIGLENFTTVVGAIGVTINGTNGTNNVVGRSYLEPISTNNWTLYNGEIPVETVINSATGKTTPVDGDLLALVDSAASNVLKKLTWANLKATLKTYFDTIYPALAGSKVIQVAVSDETTTLTAGANKIKFRMPYAMTLTAVRASLSTAQASGSTLVTVDVNESGTTILSTKITIDNTEKTSTTATIAAVISDTALADDAEMSVDIDALEAGSVAAGLKITLIGY